ncbi:MAG: FlgO family outer membrane protein [Candidatus Omnitrophica bacterium]|nr:FlgO family outer membrane protein [Candidatus Omnitrophota bacterium]
MRKMCIKGKFLILYLVLLVFVNLARGSVIPEITNLTATISDSLVANNKKIVAVTDFTDLEGNINVLGRFIAEEFSIVLASQKKEITIIDRNQLKKLLAEKKISSTGVIDPGFAKQIGSISGAEVILTGTVYPVAEGLYVSVKLIDVNSARIFAGESSIILRNKAIDDLIKVSYRLTEPITAQKTLLAQQVKEAYDFIFILKEALMDGSTMILSFEIINNSDQERYLTIDSIKGIDDTGRIYFPSSVSVGLDRAIIGESGKIQSYSGGKISDKFDVQFRKHQQLKAQVKLQNISRTAKSIGILEMVVAPVTISDRLGTFLRQEDELSKIQFTNIPILREKNGTGL